MHRNERATKTNLKHGDYAMTFDEIGAVIGCNRQTAWVIYQRGMRKLRTRYPGILHELREAALQLEANRPDNRCIGDDDGTRS